MLRIFLVVEHPWSQGSKGHFLLQPPHLMGPYWAVVRLAGPLGPSEGPLEAEANRHSAWATFIVNDPEALLKTLAEGNLSRPSRGLRHPLLVTLNPSLWIEGLILRLWAKVSRDLHGHPWIQLPGTFVDDLWRPLQKTSERLTVYLHP
jgi:hypothetical protein